MDLEPSPAVDHLPVELRVLPTRNPDCRPGVGIDDPVRTAGMRHLFRANIDGPGACHVSVEAEQVQAIAGARIVVTFPACRVDLEPLKVGPAEVTHSTGQPRYARLDRSD